MSDMKLIGLTGSIGSGKSIVAGIFRTLGIPVYPSDDRGKYLMEHSPEMKEAIRTLLGPESYTKAGLPDRKWIASVVFNDKEKLNALNSIVHPAVYNDLTLWMKDQQEAPYAIQESALIYEANLVNRFHAVILVVANEEIRIQRVMQRDQVSREKVLARMENQMADIEKMPFADYIIFNDQERSLIRQVTDVDVMLRAT